MKKWFEEKKEWIKRHFNVFDTILFVAVVGITNDTIYTFVKTLMERHYILALFNFMIMAYWMFTSGESTSLFSPRLTPLT